MNDRATRSAWRLALRTYRAHPGQCLGFVLVQFALRLIVLLPLLFLLVTDPAHRWMRELAWLCVPAFVFIVLPARQSAAFAMKRLLAGEGDLFAPDLLCCGASYGLRLWRGLKRLLLMLPWCVPLAAGVLYAGIRMNGTIAGETDGLSLIVAIGDLGGGNTVRGALMLAAAFALLLLILLTGLAFYSGARHEEAWGSRRIVLMRNRMRTIGVWFAGLALLLPFAAALAYLLYHYARSDDLMNFAANMLTMLVQGQLPLPGRHALAALAAVAVLLLPVIPLRSLLSASRVALLHRPDSGAAQ